MDKIIIPVRVKHFLGDIDFGDNCNCAIAKATRDVFPEADRIAEGVDFLYIDQDWYRHKYFGKEEFFIEQAIAERLADKPEAILFTLELTPL